jgi:hypothetical protein
MRDIKINLGLWTTKDKVWFNRSMNIKKKKFLNLVHMKTIMKMNETKKKNVKMNTNMDRNVKMNVVMMKNADVNMNLDMNLDMNLTMNVKANANMKKKTESDATNGNEMPSIHWLPRRAN